jgi:hypothetical protein
VHRLLRAADRQRVDRRCHPRAAVRVEAPEPCPDLEPAGAVVPTAGNGVEGPSDQRPHRVERVVADQEPVGAPAGVTFGPKARSDCSRLSLALPAAQSGQVIRLDCHDVDTALASLAEGLLGVGGGRAERAENGRRERRFDLSSRELLGLQFSAGGVDEGEQHREVPLRRQV